MTSRSQLELDALEIARRQPRLERLETQQTDLEKELGAIAKRLKLDPEDAEGWEKIREEALAEAARIREEKIAPVDVRSSTDKGVDAQLTRIEALQNLYRELRAKKEELLAARAELTTEPIKFSTGGTLEALRDGWDSASGLPTAPLFEINETPVTLLGLLRIFVILKFAWLLSKGVRRGLQRLVLDRHRFHQVRTLGQRPGYRLWLAGPGEQLRRRIDHPVREEPQGWRLGRAAIRRHR